MKEPLIAMPAAAVDSIVVARLGIGSTTMLTARGVGIELEAIAGSRPLAFSAAFNDATSAPG